MNPQNLERLGPHDIILASYPGSGAAWLGCLFVKLGIFYLDGYHEVLRDERQQRSDVLPIARRDRLPIYRDRDLAHPAYREPIRVIKTHLDAPAVAAATPCRTLLLVRDGRDAVLSYYHWLKNFADLDESLDNFLQRGTAAEPGSPARAWSDFNLAWSATRPADSLHLVRFEDLRADPARGVQSMLAAFGVERSDAEIAEAIEACSFSSMQRQEAAAVAADPQKLGPGMIMRRGEIGEWRNAIPAHLLAQVQADAAPALSAFGYETAPESTSAMPAAPAPSSNAAPRGDAGAFDREGAQLIFVIGPPRSGSTLLQRILGGHPEIHTVAEPWFMLHTLYGLRWGGIETEYHAGLAREALRDFLDQLPEGEATYLAAIREMAAVLYGTSLATSGKRLFLDKTPRYHYIAGDLPRVFPKAKFIFLLRNPLAVLASVLDSWFGNNPKALKGATDHMRDLHDAWRNILVAMARVGEAGITIRYEDLVSDPLPTVEKLCAHLGIAPTPQMIEYGASAPPKGRMGDSIGVPKHRAPVTDSLDKWLDTLARPDCFDAAKSYLDHLSSNDVLARLGYDGPALAAQLDDALTRRIISTGSDAGLLPANRRREIARDVCTEAENAFEQGALDTAVEDMIRALQIDPACTRAASDLGAILWMHEEPRLALARFEQAFAANPGDATATLNFADALAQCGREGDARSVCLRSLQVDPDSADVFQRSCMFGENVEPPVAARQGLTVTPENFAEFTYSRRSHFAALGLPPEHAGENIDACNLKTYQDMLLYRFVLDNFPPGARLLEIGGGDSRIIRWLKDRYEFWNLDKLEGAGNGLTALTNTDGFVLVRDYIGAFSKKLPDNYFDGVLSLSTLEHVPEDDATLAAICADIDRVLKPGGLSGHAFDILMRSRGFWFHKLIPWLHAQGIPLNPEVPQWKIRADADTWGMTRAGYEKLWQPITKKPFEVFGVPLSYNVFWRKG